MSRQTRANRKRFFSALENLEGRKLFTTFTPADGPALQTAINNAQLGDTITLQAGVTYQNGTSGGFTLKNKTTGSGYITIQSSKLNLLPAAGNRVSPADAVNMPKLQSPGFNVPIVQTQDYAHNYQFLGVEFVGPANHSTLVTMVQFGNDTQTDPAVVPNHFTVDRCYFRPAKPSDQIRRALGLHAQYVDITNSYIQEIHEGADSNAIAGWNGLGNYNIINNRLEGSGENILFGGSTNHMPQPITNVVIKNNHFIKPLAWRGVWAVKNLFELKQGKNFDIQNNIFENCWVSGQTGVAIVLKLGDYDTSPANETSNIMFKNNIVQHANGAIALQGRDYASNSPDGLVHDLSIINNVFDDINGKWGTTGTGSGTFNIYTTNGPKNVTIDHNTFFNGYTTVETDPDADTYPLTNFKFTNNIANHSLYGFRSTNGSGDPVFTAYYNEGTPAQAQARITRNALIGGPNGYKYTTRLTYFPADYNAVGFVNQANGDYRLLPTSPYHAGNANQGTDGKDLGADIDTLNAGLATVMSGITTPSDMTAPTVTARSFQFQTGMPYVSFTLSKPVNTLSMGNVTFSNLDTVGGAVPAVSSVDWIAASNTVKFFLTPGTLPDGNLRATLTGVHDAANNALTGNAGIDFAFLRGDGVVDGTVNALDFNTLAAHFGATTGFVNGDYNFDGKVNTLDFTAMAQRWGKQLAAPPASALAAAATGSLFSSKPVGSDQASLDSLI